MALIGKIRDNSWILIVLIALGMGGFILQDIISNQGMRSAADFELAKVNGKKIDYKEFQHTEQVLYAGAPDPDPYAQREYLWGYFKDKAIVESESEALGIGVSTEELVDLQFGENPSPVIISRFKDANGMLDRERLEYFRSQIENNTLEDRVKEYWAIQEKEIIKEKQQTKLLNLFVKAVYTPKWMAEELSKEAASMADFIYVKVPFEKLDDKDIKVTDEDIKTYLDKNKKKYINLEETRVMKYLEWEVIATPGDSIKAKDEIQKLYAGFETATNDSLFVINNSGNISPVYYKSEDIPGELKEKVAQMFKGEIYGPYFDVDKYTIAKLVDKKVVADSVKARHILIGASPQNPSSFSTAQAKIDSIKQVLDKGGDFADLAARHSEDSGSAQKGGDLGYFAQGTMVGPFNDACFHGDKSRKYHVVSSQFGVHLIQVMDRKFVDSNPKYKLAYVSVPLIPSQETQDSIYNFASELLIASSDMVDLEANAKKNGMELKESNPMKESDYLFMNFGSSQTSRDIIRWAYQPGVDKGDISDVVYIYENPERYYNSHYVLVGLDKIFPKGQKSVEDARKTLEVAIKNELKGKKIAAAIKGKSIEAVAKQYSVTVDTTTAATFSNRFMPNIGNEPKVLSSVFFGEINKASKPIVGNSGVFIVKPLVIKMADKPREDIDQMRMMHNSQVKGEAGFRFMESLRNKAEVKDNRYKYY
ncbi:MAG TPA: hypothetical protein DCX89_07705 [Saprospirales bacterium]|nr:hypothetical protein [Saprospirales bacterium]HAY71762.1 hypothetical protein [Saprospirales bacterium]HRQ28689.1 peptidylprolyl isomerase [Saprospiraceae bacterium]